MNSGNSAQNLRLDFTLAKMALIAAGFPQSEIEAAVLSQSFLRLEQPLTQNTTTYSFAVLSNQSINGASVRPTERRLQLQDAFYIATTNIYLTKTTAVTDTNLQLHTYPNPVVWATTGEAAALETFYNGFWTLIVNNTTIIPAFDLMSYRQVYQTQQTALTQSATVAAPIDQFDGSNNVINQPNPVLIGQKGNQFLITLPGAIATAVDNYTYMVVILRGVLAQNVTVVS